MNPTKCPHCGTVAAEWHCHICKRDKINAAPQIRPEREEAIAGQPEWDSAGAAPYLEEPMIGYEAAWPV